MHVLSVEAVRQLIHVGLALHARTRSQQRLQQPANQTPSQQSQGTPYTGGKAVEGAMQPGLPPREPRNQGANLTSLPLTRTGGAVCVAGPCVSSHAGEPKPVLWPAICNVDVHNEDL